MKTAPPFRLLPDVALLVMASSVCFRAAALPPERDVPEDAPAAGQLVQLPHALRDGGGFTWNVNQDGSVTDLNGAVFTAGAQLVLGNEGNFQYASPNGQATFDPAHNELTFPPMPAAGLSVSRRISVDTRGGWCRFVEVLENPNDGPVRTQVHVRSHLAANLQAIQAVQGNGGRNGAADAAQPHAVAVSDGDDGIAFVVAGRGAKLLPQFQAQPQADFVNVMYDVEVPPRKTVAIVHVQARRPNLNEAIAFARSTKDRQFLKGLDRSLLKAVVNFPPAEQFFAGVDVLRGDLLDAVELRGGDVYKGTLRHESYRIKTPYGLVELPASRVVGMVTVGEFRPVQLLVTDGGEVFGGALADDVVRLELSSGHVTTLPLSSVRRLGYRLRPDEAEDGNAAPAPPAEKPVVMLRAGDRVVVSPPAAPIAVATCYGVLRLDPKSIASLSFQSDEHGVHEVRLVDGSRLAGVVAQDRFELKPAGAAGGGAGAKQPVAFAAAAISRLQLAPEVAEVGTDVATLKLSNGDLLVGSLSGKVVLETAFDAIEVNAGELSGMRPGGNPDGDGAAAVGEVQLTLWDGATLSGRVRGDVVDCALKCGVSLRVPVAMVLRYAQPDPRPSERAVARIKEVVEQLDDDDWKVRDRAAAQLESMGRGAAAVLKSLREGQPPEVRQRIDQILAALNPETAPPAQAPAQQARPVEIEVEERG